KRAHAQARWNMRLPGDVDAGAGRTELEPVIGAPDVVARTFALGERHAAMATAVFERGNSAGVGAIEHHGKIADPARHRCCRDVGSEAYDIPVVEHECVVCAFRAHVVLPSRRSCCCRHFASKAPSLGSDLTNLICLRPSVKCWKTRATCC